jgi:site-specific DNA-methyltransferase (adenine-specific)
VNRLINQVLWGDALRLLAGMPGQSVDAVITDPMYGVARQPNPKLAYDWGQDPCRGDPNKWGAYHRPIYEECRRVLRPGGTLAWAMGINFRDHFSEWFGGYRIWSFSWFKVGGMNVFRHIWVVQDREQRPIRFPDRDSLIVYGRRTELLKTHPCPKAVEEMAFLVENLTRPNDIVLDCFAGIGSTLVAAQRLGRRWIGCDLSRSYCRVALRRLRPWGGGVGGAHDKPH